MATKLCQLEYQLAIHVNHLLDIICTP